MGVGHSVALAHSHPKKGLANMSSDYINRTPIEVQNCPGLQLPCCYQKVAIPLAIKIMPYERGNGLPGEQLEFHEARVSRVNRGRPPFLLDSAPPILDS